MRHGVVLLPELRWIEAAERWRRAEQLGFDHAWTFDHLMWRSLRQAPWFSALPTLTAAAGVTRRIRIGTLVASPYLRHPVTFAKEVMTLDDISGGRFICGVGAGAAGYDAAALGLPELGPARLADRFEEFVTLLDTLLRHDETTYRGEHYRSEAVMMNPGCLQRPRVPFALAAAGPRGLRLAARHAQTWLTIGIPGCTSPTRFDRARPMLAGQLRRLAEACRAEGRDADGLNRMVVAGAQIGGVLESAQAFADARGMFAELGFSDMLVFWPRPDSPFAGDPAILERIAPMLGGAVPVGLT